MTIQFVNLMPHPATIVTSSGVISVPPSGQLCRVRTTSVTLGEVGGVPVYVDEFGEVEGLPDPQDGVVLLVSGLVLAALRGSGRRDVLAPGTGPQDGPVRSPEGQVVGVTRLKAVQP